MQIGLQLFGPQLVPIATAAGRAWPAGALDPLHAADGGVRLDFLLVGGTPPGGVSGIGRAADLIVPLAAAFLCMSAPGLEIVAKLNCWAFDPVHVARMGGNLACLTRERWSLYLDGEGRQWNAPLRDEAAGLRVREFLAAVQAHWAGTADFVGQHLRSKGRMVGPRPTTRPPILLDSDLAASAALRNVALQGEVVGIEGVARRGGTALRLVTCPVVLSNCDEHAAARARERKSPTAPHCLVGTPQSVAAEIKAALKGSPVARLALGFPALPIAELSIAWQALMPLLRSMAA